MTRRFPTVASAMIALSVACALLPGGADAQQLAASKLPPDGAPRLTMEEHLRARKPLLDRRAKVEEKKVATE